MRAALGRAKVEISHIRSNPFDLVPNIAGGANTRISSLKRCLRMSPKIAKDNGGNSAVSPHTLPYLGIQTYLEQLQMSGENRAAKRVKRYIEKRDKKGEDGEST